MSRQIVALRVSVRVDEVKLREKWADLMVPSWGDNLPAYDLHEGVQEVLFGTNEPSLDFGVEIVDHAVEESWEEPL